MIPQIRETVEALRNQGYRDIWGALISYTPIGGTPITVAATGKPLMGVFDAPFLVVSEGYDQAEVVSSAPSLEMVLADIEGLFEPLKDDVFTILTPGFSYSGKSFTVTEAHRDSAGAVTLICKSDTYS